MFLGHDRGRPVYSLSVKSSIVLYGDLHRAVETHGTFHERVVAG